MTWADDLRGMAAELSDLVTVEPVLLAVQATACHQLLADVMRVVADDPDSPVSALLRARMRPYIDKQREAMASAERRREEWLRVNPDALRDAPLPGVFRES